MNENKEEIPDFSHSVRQNILYRMAEASKDKVGRSFLIEYEIVMKLLARIGKAPLVKKFGEEKTQEILIKLEEIGRYVSKINFFLMLKIKDISDERYMEAMKYYTYVVDYLGLIYRVYYILLDATSDLKYMNIPHEYLSEDKKNSKQEK